MRKLCAFVLALVVPAACAGGGNTVTPAHPTPQSVSVKTSITIPGPGSAGTRRRSYVSVNTQSVSFTVANANTPLLVIDTTPSSPNCAQAAAGLICSATLSLQPGTVRLTIDAYASTGGTGALLARSTTSITVTAQSANSFAFTLGGVPASATVLPLNASPIPPGAPATQQAMVLARDASGATIVGGDDYATPIALQFTDASGGHLSISTTSVASPAQLVTLSYDGASTAVGATVAAVVNGTPGAPYTFGPSGLAFSHVATIGPSYGNVPGIANGPAGSGQIWFANGTAAGFVDIHSGTVTTVPTSANVPTPLSVIEGSNHRMWIAGQLGGLETALGASDVVNYPNASPNSSVQGLTPSFQNATVAPDGSTWYGDFSGATLRVDVDPAAQWSFASQNLWLFWLTACGNSVFGSNDANGNQIAQILDVNGVMSDGGTVNVSDQPLQFYCADPSTLWVLTKSTLARVAIANPFGASTIAEWTLPAHAIQYSNLIAYHAAAFSASDAWITGGSSIVHATGLAPPSSSAVPQFALYATGGTNVTTLLVGPDGALWYSDGTWLGRVLYGMPES